MSSAKAGLSVPSLTVKLDSVGGLPTKTLHVANFVPSFVEVTVMVALPSANPVTKPFWSTAAIVESLDSHVTS